LEKRKRRKPSKFRDVWLSEWIEREEKRRIQKALKVSSSPSPPSHPLFHYVFEMKVLPLITKVCRYVCG